MRRNLLRLAQTLIIFVALSGFTKPAFSAKNFSFHLLHDPGTTDPIKASDVSQKFLFTNLFRPLYQISPSGEAIPDQATTCQWKNPLRLECQLKDDLKWSNGEPLTAEDFERTFKRIFKDNPEKSQHILSLKNATKILQGNVGVDRLGVRTKNKNTIIFEFDLRDSEFVSKIANSEFGPTPKAGFPSTASSNSLVVNGPYKVLNWEVGKVIRLVPNPHFVSPRKVSVDVFFVPDHLTAYNLYMTNKLSFLRTLPAELIDKHQKSKGYFETFVARYDHIGMSNKVPKTLRQSIINALNYEELQKLYRSKGRPGCPGFYESPNDSPLCIVTLKKKVKASQVDFKGIFIASDRAGGADFITGAVWFQNQLKKMLGVHIEVRAKERGLFMQGLKDHTLPIFRRSIQLDRPTCLAALETFLSESPANSIQFKSAEFDSIVKKMASIESENTFANCSKAHQILIDTQQIIPLGPVFFAMLKKPNFTNWTLNSISELNLSNLDTSP